MAVAATEFERKLALLEQMNKIPSFTGTNPYCSLALFMKEFNEWAEFFKWQEEDKFFILRKKLEGEAASIISIHEDSITSTDEIFNLLKVRLAPKSSPNDKLQDLWQFRQTPNMLVEDWVSLARKKAKLAAEAHSCTRDKIEEATEEWLLNALKNNVLPQYKREILRKNPKTSKEFVEYAKIEEATWKETNSVNIAEGETCNALVANSRTNNLEKIIEEMSNQMKLLNAKISDLEKEKQSVNEPPEPQINQNNVLICKQCGYTGHGFINCRVNPPNMFNNINRQPNYVRRQNSGYFRGSANSYRGRPNNNDQNRGVNNDQNPNPNNIGPRTFYNSDRRQQGGARQNRGQPRGHRGYRRGQNNDSHLNY